MIPDQSDSAIVTKAAQVEAYFAALLNSAVDAIIVIDHRGRIEIFNHAAEEMFGYAAGKILDQNVAVLMPEPNHSAHDQYITNFLSTRQPKIIGIGREVIALRRDGSEFPVHLTVSEIIQMEPPRFIGIVRDMSEQHRLENEAREFQSELTHATRLSELGEMTAGIAHEINQPLSAISTYANACHRMLAGEKTDVEELLNTLHLITDQAQRAGEVVRRLRTFTRKRPSHRESLDINTLIDTTIRLVQSDIQLRKFRLHKNLAPASPHVLVDPIQIQQVVLNLVRNAMDAVEDNAYDKKVIVVETVLETSNFVRISIVDRGTGISGDAADKVFDAFFTTKETGTGVGLSISRTIVTMHDGDIGYWSNEDGGTTFYFTLPCITEKNKDG